MAGKDLRELRKQMLLKQSHMSEILGVHWTTLSDWERAKADVPHHAALIATLIAEDASLRDKVVKMTVTP